MKARTLRALRKQPSEAKLNRLAQQLDALCAAWLRKLAKDDTE